MEIKEIFKLSISDVEKFAEISGDFNPIHINEDYAKTTFFGERIVHGTFVNAIIGKLLGTKLPGEGTVLLSQDLKFLAPVFLNKEYEISVKVSDVNFDKNRIILDTSVSDKLTQNYCITGKAIVKNKEWIKRNS
jgi:3-hydroxybutyryl-CoA dehydratase